MQTEPLSAIAYIRVSSQRQVTEGNSLAVQRNLVIRFAELKGFRLLQIFVEEAETAKNDDRPILQEMLAKVGDGSIVASVLIIPKIDRLARNRDDYGDIKKALKRSGIRIESCSETLEDTPAGRFAETMLASVAQFDNEVRSERSRDGMIEAVKEGRWVWKAPPGYKNVRVGDKKGGIGTIAPNEPVATLLREAFDRIASRRQTVAEARHWLACRKQDFARGNFYHLLKNPVYCGVISAFGGEFEAKPPFVPLITREQFALVQTVIKRNPRLPTVYDHDNPDYPLRGCLRCEGCGSFLTAAWSSGRNSRFPYYRCLSCQNVNLSRNTFEGLFVAELALFKPDRETVAVLKSSAEAAYKRKTAKNTNKRLELNSELTRVTELRRQVALKTAEGIIPDDLGKEQMASLSSEMASLVIELRKVEPTPNELAAALDFAEAFFQDLPKRWKLIGIKVKKRLQTFFFPEGLVAEKVGKLRTGDYPLLEQVKATFCAKQFDLVDLNLESPNHESDVSTEVSGWLIKLYHEFAPLDESKH